MIRKFALAFAAVAALGTASLVTTTTEASAHGWHRHHHHHGFWRGGGFRFYGGPAYASYAYGGCYVRRIVPTPWGPRVRVVNICY
jgi:hypothetical protein